MLSFQNMWVVDINDKLLNLFIELLQPVPVPGMGGRSLERILTAPLEVGDALLVQLREAGLAIIKGLVPRMLWTATGRQTAEA